MTSKLKRLRRVSVVQILSLLVFAIGQHLHAQQSTKLSLSASLKQSGSELELTWTNGDASSCLLSVGGILGQRPIYAFKLLIAGDNINGSATAGIAREGVIEGRLDPWVIFMPPRASYVLRIATNDILAVRSGKALSQIKGRWRLAIKYVGTPEQDTAPGGKRVPFSLTQNGPTTVPFCAGSLSTDVRHE